MLHNLLRQGRDTVLEGKILHGKTWMVRINELIDLVNRERVWFFVGRATWHPISQPSKLNSDACGYVYRFEKLQL